MGTFIVNNSNYNEIQNHLIENDLYLVSPYYTPNHPLSCNLLIDDFRCVVFPVSEQILYTLNNKLEYIGNKYLNSLSQQSILVKETAIKIGYRLQNIGYRGICGFDFIYFNNQVMLIEINPRYQGSSYVINYVLRQNKLPSLFELNSICFSGKISDDITKKIDGIRVPYANIYLEYRNFDDFSEIQGIISNGRNLVFLDGYNNAIEFEKDCYLLRYLFPCDEL